MIQRSADDYKDSFRTSRIIPCNICIEIAGANHRSLTSRLVANPGNLDQRACFSVVCGNQPQHPNLLKTTPQRADSTVPAETHPKICEMQTQLWQVAPTQIVDVTFSTSCRLGYQYFSSRMLASLSYGRSLSKCHLLRSNLARMNSSNAFPPTESILTCGLGITSLSCWCLKL